MNGNKLGVVGFVLAPSLDQNDTLTFNYTPQSPETKVVRLLDATRGVSIIINSNPRSPVPYIINKTLTNRSFVFAQGPGSVDWAVTCTPAPVPGLPIEPIPTSDPVGPEAQSTATNFANTQSTRVDYSINTALGARLAEPDADSSSSGFAANPEYLEAMAGLGLIDSDGEPLESSTGLEKLFGTFASAYGDTGDLVTALDATSNLASDSINDALRAVGMGEGFFFSDVTGTLVKDDRNNVDRSGSEIIANVGFGYNFSKKWTAGLAGSYGYADRPIAAEIGDIESNAFLINPFVAYSDWGLVFSVNGGIGWQENEVQVPELPLFEGKFDQTNYNIAGAVQGTVRAGAFSVTPRGTLSYSRADLDGYVNNGGLNTPDSTQETGLLSALARAEHDGWSISNDVRLLPYGELGVNWAFKRPDSAPLAIGGTWQRAEWTGDLAGGLDFLWRSGLLLTIEGSYRGIGENDLERFGVTGKAAFKW